MPGCVCRSRKRVDHPPAAHLDALRSKPARLVARLVRGQRPVRPNDAPPRQVAPVLRQEPADRAGGTLVPGPARHLPIGDDLATGQVSDDVTEALLQRGHRPSIARVERAAERLPEG